MEMEFIETKHVYVYKCPKCGEFKEIDIPISYNPTCGCDSRVQPKLQNIFKMGKFLEILGLPKGIDISEVREHVVSTGKQKIFDEDIDSLSFDVVNGDVDITYKEPIKKENLDKLEKLGFNVKQLRGEVNDFFE